MTLYTIREVEILKGKGKIYYSDDHFADARYELTTAQLVWMDGRKESIGYINTSGILEVEGNVELSRRKTYYFVTEDSQGLKFIMVYRIGPQAYYIRVIR